MKRIITVVFISLGIYVSVLCQAPEVHQLAAVAQFTGIYSFIGSYIAIRELYFLAGLITILIAGNVLITFFQLPSMFLPVHHNQKRSISPRFASRRSEDTAHIEVLLRIIKIVEGYIDEHPLISIPEPHLDDHPGLAQFTGASIVPMLRFYSFSFRTFIIMALALLLILRPYFKFISIHGKNSPAVFQKKVGKVKWDFRSLEDYDINWTRMEEMAFILKSIDSMF